MFLSYLIILPEAVSSRHSLEPFTGGNHAPRRLSQKEERSRFLKKAAQKLFLCLAMGVVGADALAQMNKAFFSSFCSQKEAFPFASLAPSRGRSAV
jgi:hypothetical protein